ncbi:Phox and Bem1p domain protein [Ceratobasidium sp. AG-Ba]|nr:Phox and Bem1p domain protein [Ceratobasidium sp. AG-Ba]
MATIKLTWNGMTRRALFPDEHPSWNDLSHRVEAMFKIPASSVSLSYVDSDGDTMFISSNDELFDFFHTERSQTDGKPVHRFTVFDQRQNRSPGDDFEHVPPSTHPDEEDAESSSASSASSSDVEVPNLDDVWPAASAANVKSPSQGHISPVPTDIAAAEAGQSRSQFARTVSASSARSESTIGDHEGNPTIHIQQPSNDSMSEAEADPITPAATMHPMHPTPALYHDAANFVNALSGAVDAHPEVSNSLRYLIMNASSGAYWDAIPPPEEIHQASAHRLLDSIDSLLRTFFPPPPPSTPTQHTATASQYAPSQYTQSQYAQSQYAPTATPYTAAGFELPPSVRGDETPVPSRLHTPHNHDNYQHSDYCWWPGDPTGLGYGSRRSLSVRSDTDAGSIVSGMDSPSGGPAWRFAGRTGGVATPRAGGVGMMGGMSGGTWKHYPPHPALNTQTGAMIPMSQPDPRSTPEAAKYVESRVKLEHMKEMYKQTKEEYRREREERKRERERKKQERMMRDMYDRLNQALNDVPGRVGMRSEPDTAVRTRQQLNNWLTEQLADMGFSVTTHPQVGRLVRDATRPFAANAEAANENALLEDLLAQLVPTSSKA